MPIGVLGWYFDSKLAIARPLLLRVSVISLYSVIGAALHTWAPYEFKGIAAEASAVGAFALTFLIGFRNGTAYDRWWEARKTWGTLSNNARNFAVKLSPGSEQSGRATGMSPAPDRIRDRVARPPAGFCRSVQSPRICIRHRSPLSRARLSGGENPGIAHFDRTGAAAGSPRTGNHGLAHPRVHGGCRLLRTHQVHALVDVLSRPPPPWHVLLPFLCQHSRGLGLGPIAMPAVIRRRISSSASS